MRRQLLISADVFIEVLVAAGCRIGRSNRTVQIVRSPDQPEVRAMIRLAETLDSDMIEAHIDNLGVTEDLFLDCFDRLNPRHRR